MGNTSKYDLFMEEINSLEKLVQKHVAELDSLSDKNGTLNNKLENLEKENEVLELKIKDLEKQISKSGAKSSNDQNNSLDTSDRQTLKNQIDDLIERIDYHIRS